MYPSANQAKPITKWLALLIVLLLVAGTGITWRDISLRAHTSQLSITSSDSHALIAISSTNTVANIVGTGKVDVRIKPGTYLVTGNYAGKSAQTTLVMQAHEYKSIRLNLNLPPVTPTPDSITFAGLDSLIDNGLTATQVSNIKGLFFNYKHTAQNIVISNVEPGPHDPNSSDPTLIITFTGTVDGASYSAVVSYSGFDDVNLVLTDPVSEAQLYSGSSVQSAPDS